MIAMGNDNNHVLLGCLFHFSQVSRFPDSNFHICLSIFYITVLAQAVLSYVKDGGFSTHYQSFENRLFRNSIFMVLGLG